MNRSSTFAWRAVLSFSAAAFVASSWLSSTARAQDAVQHWSGAASLDYFGSALARAGDLDADGVDDVVIGVPNHDTQFFHHAGAAYAYSGRDGALLRQWEGIAADAVFGTSVAAASDVDGDGHGDVLVGAPGQAGGPTTGSVYVYSGATGILIRELDGDTAGGSFGYAMTAIDDVDGDGVRDHLIGAYSANAAYVHSGATGALLRKLTTTTANSGFGFAVSGIDDITGDGISDLLVASPFWTDPTGVTRGRVQARSGADGSALWATFGENTSAFVTDFFGWDIATVGDLDGDGFDDLLVGAWGHGACQEGRAYLVSGVSGAAIGSVDGASCGDWAGYTVTGLPDVDGDLIADFALGTPNHAGNGRVTFYSGATRAVLATLDGATNARLGVRVAGLGDIDHDRVADVLVASIGSASSFAGDVSLLRLAAPKLQSITPNRALYRNATTVTILGDSFHAGASTRVSIGGTDASNVVVVDQQTLQCTVAADAPGPADVVVTDGFGAAVLGGGFVHTPAVLLNGSFQPGGSVTVRALVTPSDSLLLVCGLPPLQSIRTPPFDGTLAILPYQVLFVVNKWPLEEFTVSGSIPNDPALSGLSILFQQLAGPRLSGAGKDGCWSNCAVLAIQ